LWAIGRQTGEALVGEKFAIAQVEMFQVLPTAVDQGFEAFVGKATPGEVEVSEGLVALDICRDRRQERIRHLRRQLGQVQSLEVGEMGPVDRREYGRESGGGEGTTVLQRQNSHIPTPHRQPPAHHRCLAAIQL